MRRRVKIYLQEVHKHTYAPTLKFKTKRIAYTVGKKAQKCVGKKSVSLRDEEKGQNLFARSTQTHVRATLNFETNRIAYSVGKKGTKIRW